MVDTLAETKLPVYAEELPHSFELTKLPALHVHEIGPAARSPALNTLGVDVQDVDLEIFVTPEMWDSGEAHDLAHRLRSWLMHRSRGAFRIQDIGRPIRRPDINEAVRRYAFTIRIALPA
ncbi:hypothetical protein CAQU_09865 [Corynebacterium aquilae DSM 44791]|uniref:Uncharacterized protein n=1 Tax=Corynebacterium aquilae DSM 44791 TaxID=1431546 RepID=A0A1L7CHI8_9CORY|nr:hypothetical protein CAQU_09865 [Corynebacterium aquilae DSM 44791]